MAKKIYNPESFVTSRIQNAFTRVKAGGFQFKLSGIPRKMNESGLAEHADSTPGLVRIAYPKTELAGGLVNVTRAGDITGPDAGALVRGVYSLADVSSEETKEEEKVNA